MTSFPKSRKNSLFLSTLVLLLIGSISSGVVLLNGCSPLTFPSKSSSLAKKNKKKKDQYRVAFVRDYATPYDMHLVAVNGIGLVCGLRGTGSDVPPGPEREYILRELQKLNVDRPNELIRSKDTALVRLEGIFYPGIQEGDRFDVKVNVQTGSEVTSLRGGYLVKTPLKEMDIIGMDIKQGFTLGYAEGPVMLNPSINDKSTQMERTYGKILGGGVAKKGRTLGLIMKEEHVSEFNTSQIEKQINRRFYLGIQNDGVATAKTDSRIEVRVHPAYKDNIERYVQVLMWVACYERAEQRSRRIAELKKSILDPVTAQSSAFQLEALGKEGIPTLKLGLESPDKEVQFYAAESLAYLNVVQAVQPLQRIAREEPAFRARALGALGAMQSDLDAELALRELLNENSAETRYGAFRALWFRNPYDLAIRGETVGKAEGYKFNYHVLNTTGPAMVHATYGKHPELVLFNSDIKLIPNFVLEAGLAIIVQCTNGRDTVVTRLNSYGMNETRTIPSTMLDDVIRAVIDLGGTYPDVIQMLLEARDQKVLPCRIEFDKLPQGGRIFSRVKDDEVEEEEEEKKKSFWSKANPKTWFQKDKDSDED